MQRVAKNAVGALLATTTILVGAACGSSGGGGGGGSQTSSFVGIVASDDGLLSGSITITVATSTLAPPAVTEPNVRDPVNATGTLSLGGVQTPLTGAYDPDLDALALTGGGYDFGGGFDGVDRLEGFWTGPGGTSGTFVTSGNSGAVAYCGTYDADDQSDSGTFSIVVAGNTISGEAVSSFDASHIPLDGVLSGTTISIYFPGTTTPLATGTRSGNNVSGTYDDQQGSTGTWSGSLCP